MSGAKSSGRRFLKSRASRVALFLFFCVAVGSCVSIREVSRRFVFPASSTPLTPTRSWDAIDVEVVSYVTSDGIALRGAHIHPKDAPEAPVILFFHGNGESVEDEVVLGEQMARHLQTDVFLGEYRGYGGASGSPSEAGLFRDGRAAVVATRRKPDEIVLAGWSLGTGVAVELAHEGVGRSLVLLAPFQSTVSAARSLLSSQDARDEMAKHLGPFAPLFSGAKTIVDSPFGWLAIGDHFDSASAIKTVQIPIFIAHGDCDETVPFDDGAALSRLAPHATFLPISGQDHFIEQTKEAAGAFELALGRPVTNVSAWQ